MRENNIEETTTLKIEMENEDFYKSYATDVIEGKIVTCKYVKQACQRYLDFFNKYDFRVDKVKKVVNFISHLKHYTGKHNGKPFILHPYQLWIISSIFGFYKKGTDKRVCNYVYIELARKSGKTALMAAICLYMLIADGENGFIYDVGKNISENFADKLMYIYNNYEKMENIVEKASEDVKKYTWDKFAEDIFYGIYPEFKS